MDALYEQLRAALAAEQPAARAVIIAAPGEAGGQLGAQMLIRPGHPPIGSLGQGALDAEIAALALEMLPKGINQIIIRENGLQIFLETFPPPPTLYMIGAVHIAIALTHLVKPLGFRTVVIDARDAFATDERFSHADELINAWPDEALEGRLDAYSFVAVLTHDPKLDDPALRVALPSAARYIGALGSPKTHAARLERLRAEGFSEAQLARIHGPIGIKIGAKTPEEIAVSILAEMIRTHRQKE